MVSSETEEAAEITESYIVSVEQMSSSLAGTVGSATDVSAEISDPIFSLLEVEDVIQKYGILVEKFQFDQARELIDEYRYAKSKQVLISNSKDAAWATLLSTLAHIATCDKNYYLLSFLQPKAFFRKENALKNQYLQIRLDNLVLTALKYSYAINNISMLYDFRCSAPSTYRFAANDRVINWESMQSRGEKVLEMSSACHHHALSAMAHLFSEEIDILLLLISAQIHISNCRMFESLLQLKEIRERFDFWVRDLESLNPINKPVFLFFKLVLLFLLVYNLIALFLSLKYYRSVEKVPRNRLIHWLIQFYNLLMAKFSLYFTDVLGHYCSVDDIKTIHTIDNGFNFISNANQFLKKTGAVYLTIVMDRRDCKEDFYGLGYHRLDKRFTPGAPAEPLSGLSSRCPAVFKLPNPTDVHKQPQNQIFEKHQEYVASFINLCFPQGPVRHKYHYDAEHDYCLFGDLVEGNLYLVVLYAGRIPDRDTSVLGFIQEMTTALRGSKLFLALKNAAK
uniref:Vacuolar fusion protein MON1 homolog n=1 Tax=Heterorhabditis bacteriophora TaxID=37862 RepID=A0A1I7XFT7_HETBA